MITSPEFPCLGARAAWRQRTYGFRLYDQLGSRSSAQALCSDLYTFALGRRRRKSRFATYVASFRGPRGCDEETFEHLLWQQLQLLHDVDASRHAWDPRVSSDPGDAGFSFSVGGAAYFVVGLHAASSREARRFSWPTLCFNPHEQFDDLRERGQYARLRDRIRKRDHSLQGSINPMLSDHGAASEAAQYSGRLNPSGWKCPLHVHAAD